MAGIFYYDTVINRLKIDFKLSFTEMKIMCHVYYFDHSSTR